MDTLKNKTVLHIEDDQDFSNFVKHSVEKAGGNYTVVEHPNELVQILPEVNPDLIILDLNFFSPNREGELQIDRGEAILEFRQISPKLLMTPVIVCTAEELKNTKTELELKGANKFITKPIKPQVLIAKILILLNDFTYQCMQ